MSKASMTTYRRAARQASPNLLLPPAKVAPFGPYGAGQWTGHPIGLVIVVGLLFMGFVGLPEARWFLALAVPLGCLCGFSLRLYHR